MGAEKVQETGIRGPGDPRGTGNTALQTALREARFCGTLDAAFGASVAAGVLAFGMPIAVSGSFSLAHHPYGCCFLWFEPLWPIAGPAAILLCASGIWIRRGVEARHPGIGTRLLIGGFSASLAGAPAFTGWYEAGLLCLLWLPGPILGLLNFMTWSSWRQHYRGLVGSASNLQKR